MYNYLVRIYLSYLITRKTAELHNVQNCAQCTAMQTAPTAAVFTAAAHWGWIQCAPVVASELPNELLSMCTVHCTVLTTPGSNFEPQSADLSTVKLQCSSHWHCCYQQFSLLLRTGAEPNLFPVLLLNCRTNYFQCVLYIVQCWLPLAQSADLSNRKTSMFFPLTLLLPPICY